MVRAYPMIRLMISSCPANCSSSSFSSMFWTPNPLATAKAMAMTGTMDRRE
jgi:hypothetical protein